MSCNEQSELSEYRRNLGEPSSVLLANGVGLNYWHSGDGPPVVLLHGLFATALHWTLVAPLLAPHFSVYVPELPFGGHETSVGPHVDVSVEGQAALITMFIESLGLEDVCLVGNDTGGTVAQLALVEYPTRVSSAVITDCDAFENLPPRVFSPLCWLARVPILFTLTFHLLRFRPLLRTPLAFGWLTKRKVPKAISDYYLLLFQRRGPVRDDVIRFLRTVNNQPTVRIAAQLIEIRIPVLVAWSRDDRVFPFAHAVRLAGEIPNAVLQPCTDAYAYLPFDRPEWLAEQIRTFRVRNGSPLLDDR